jgi:hypothetical protein
MTPSFDVEEAAGVDDSPVQDLAQFEPDPDGLGSADSDSYTGPEGGDDPQWIVWPDADEESVWAAAELTQIGAGWRALKPRLARR